MNRYLFETYFMESEHEGKTYARIFKEFLLKANKNIKIPFHSQTYNNPQSTVIIYYIPEDDYEFEYDVVFERAADDMRQIGARCDIKIKPGYERNKWGDDASHTVWVYTNPGVYKEPEIFEYRDVRVPSPFDKYFKVKKNITENPVSVLGYDEKIIAWLAPITSSAKEFLSSETLKGRPCLIEDDQFPVCTLEKGWGTRSQGLYPIDIESIEKYEA